MGLLIRASSVRQTRATSPHALPYQLAHRVVDAFEIERIHPLSEELPDQGNGMGVAPMGLRHRVQPHGFREMIEDAPKPGLAGLLVPVLHRAAWRRDLVGTHG